MALEAGIKERGAMRGNWQGRKSGPRQRSGIRRLSFALLLLACLLGAVATLVIDSAQGQQVHKNPFESREPAWIKGVADAPFRETAHEMTELTAHTGQYSEHIALTAEQGSYIQYFYPTPKAPIGDELSASLFVKSNRPGMQLLARLVLPHERGAGALDERLTTLLRGDQYEMVGRWQHLELRHPVKLAKEQQQLLRAELHRDVDFSEAYIDRLILNVYGGPGKADIWIDDLEIGPVIDSSTFQTTSRPAAGGAKTGDIAPQRARNRAALVELRQDHLWVSGKRFFMRGIRHSDTPLRSLREAGFNTVWFNQSTSPAVLEEAVNLGFWIVPSIPLTTDEKRPVEPDALAREVSRFMVGDATLFWDLGGGLVAEQQDLVLHAAQAIHGADPQRPLGADVWDGFAPYSRSIDVVGTHRWPLMTTLELPLYRDWLEQRRLLARPGTYTWTWIQTHLPDWYSNLVYEHPASAGFQEPIGPQPEQIRLLTYTALAAGCRGLAFWSDRFLADSHQGRDRLLTLALLNLELQMLEPLLVSALPPRWVDSSLPEVKAAVFHTERGILALPIWVGKGAQFVPGQAAATRLSIIVPEVPIGTQAWEVSPVEVRSLQMERVIGGTRITLPEFGLTATVVFTSDNGPNGIIVRFQEQLRQMRKLAAQWAHDLAEVELDKVALVEEQLEADGHKLPDGQQLLKDARQRLRTSVEHWNNGDYRQTFQESERCLRPLRILMRAQWEQATRNLDSPVASPYAVSFFTLPRHWRFMRQLDQGTPVQNVLVGGGFEGDATRLPASWSIQQTKLDAVDFTARIVSEEPREGRQCLLLEIEPQNTILPPQALERTFLACQSPALRLPPRSLVQISGWIRIPKALKATADGALLYDSAGGEPLAVRLIGPTEWKRFVLYRRVPDSGVVSVTMALTGIGQAYFDDIRIEPLSASSTVMRPAQSVTSR
jgi:hypothetical protein